MENETKPTPQAVIPRPQFCDVEGHPSDCQCHIVRQLAIQTDVRTENLRAQAVMGKLLGILKKGDDLDPADLRNIRDEIAQGLSGTIAGDDDPCDLCGQTRKQAPRCERTFSQRHMYGLIRDGYRNEVTTLFHKVSSLVAEKKTLQSQLQQQQSNTQPQKAAEGDVQMNEQIMKSIEQIGFEWARAFFRGVSAATPTNVVQLQRTTQSAPRKAQKRASKPDGKACAVSSCERNVAAKGLCHNHWSKAHRLDMNMEKLSASDLKTLAQDGRKMRWQQKSVSKKTAAMRRSK